MKPNPVRTEFDGVECILCECGYVEMCLLVELEVCEEYNGKWYCEDCAYLAGLKDGTISEKSVIEENVFDMMEIPDDEVTEDDFIRKKGDFDEV